MPTPADFVTETQIGDDVVLVVDMPAWRSTENEAATVSDDVNTWVHEYRIKADKSIELTRGLIRDTIGNFPIDEPSLIETLGSEMGQQVYRRLAHHLDDETIAVAKNFGKTSAAVYNATLGDKRLRELLELYPSLETTLSAAIREEISNHFVEARLGRLPYVGSKPYVSSYKPSSYDIHSLESWGESAHSSIRTLKVTSLQIAPDNSSLKKTINEMVSLEVSELVARLFQLPDANRAALKYAARHAPAGYLGGSMLKVVGTMSGPGLLRNLTTDSNWKTFCQWYEFPELAIKYATNPASAQKALDSYYSPAHLATFDTPEEARWAIGQEIADYLHHVEYRPGQPAPLVVESRGFARICRDSKSWHHEPIAVTDSGTGKLELFAPSPLDGLTVPSWQSDGKTFGPYTLRQLSNSAELSEEGRVLRHCVGSYAFYCTSGGNVIFSVQDGKGQRIATAQFDSNYQLNQCLGFRNRGLPKEIKAGLQAAVYSVWDREPYTSFDAWSKKHKAEAKTLVRTIQPRKSVLRKLSRRSSEPVELNV